MQNVNKKISWDKYSHYRENLASYQLEIITHTNNNLTIPKEFNIINNNILKWLAFFMSIFLRSLCFLVLVYVTLMIVHETDSYLPLIYLIFSVGILLDLIYFIRRKKEHSGLGMMPAFWLQHEVNTSFINFTSSTNRSNMNIKYPSEKQFEETKNFELFLFGSLILIRVLLPRKDDWSLRSNLDLLMHDVIYTTDSLDFASILFDDSKKSVDKTFETLVLWCLAYTTCFFSLNPIYRPSRLHISRFHNLNLFERIELRLAYDPFVRFVVPSLFYEIPMIIFRTYILYSYELVEWNNLTFLLKNLVSIFLNVVIYFEIRQLKVDCVFYSSDLI